jgi:catechol 2,3-dioxygenase-like lactoylglutathione lyase family enzyme
VATIVTTSAFSIEALTLPVSDVDRSLRFYVDQVGFALDVDYAPDDGFRVVQLAPLALRIWFRPAGTCARRRGRRCPAAGRGAHLLSVQGLPRPTTSATPATPPGRTGSLQEVERIADLVSFYAEKLTITIDGEKQELVSSQNVVAHGADRNIQRRRSGRHSARRGCGRRKDRSMSSLGTSLPVDVGLYRVAREASRSRR